MFGNWFKTSLLMAAIVALFGVVGAALGGAQGMLVALVLGGAMNFFAYWFSDKNDDHQSARGWWHCRVVQHPPRHAGAHRAPAGAGALN